MHEQLAKIVVALGILTVITASAVTFGLLNQAQAQSSTNSTTGANNTSSSNSTAAEVKVSIVPNAATLAEKAFSPNPLNVTVGTKVVWTNDDTTLHTVTSGTGSNDTNMGKEFDSGLSGSNVLKAKGDTFSHTFDKAGNYTYFCQVHPTMIGSVVVTSAAAGVAPEFPVNSLVIPVMIAGLVGAVVYARRSGLLSGIS